MNPCLTMSQGGFCVVVLSYTGVKPIPRLCGKIRMFFKTCRDAPLYRCSPVPGVPHFQNFHFIVKDDSRVREATFQHWLLQRSRQFFCARTVICKASSAPCLFQQGASPIDLPHGTLRVSLLRSAHSKMVSCLFRACVLEAEAPHFPREFANKCHTIPHCNVVSSLPLLCAVLVKSSLADLRTRSEDPLLFLSRCH